MTSFTNWSWQDENVQSEIQNGEYVSSESTLLLAGPSRLSMLSVNDNNIDTTNSLVPIGQIQGFSAAQQRAVQRLFEVGSKRPYMVPGRHFANFTISRIMFYGPSLMRMLYALAPLTDDQLGAFGNELNTDPDSNGNLIAQISEYSNLFQDSPLKNIPGYGATDAETSNRDLFLNLASELFNVPFGMCLVFKDTRDRPYGAVYLEDCYIEAHNMQVDAAQVVIAENVSGQFAQYAPIQLTSSSFS